MGREGPQARQVHLDALRGLAAIAVVAGHIRGFVLVDFIDSGGRTLANSGVYFLTGLGHSAVLVFFALSGFLVGGSALRSMADRTWSAPDYVIARLSRLWTVLVPALATTWLIDHIGIAIAGFGAGYDGSYYGLLSSGPTPAGPATLDAATFLGNALFLQTVIVPVLGTNGPLWSLANEFWYYVIFVAVAWAALGPGRRYQRGLVLLAAITIAFTLLPLEMMILGIIWLAGAGAGASMRWKSFQNAIVGRPYRLASLALISASLIGGNVSRSNITIDLAQGCAWAIAIPAIAMVRAPGGAFGKWYRSISVASSEISFTLYATHFPVLSAVYFIFIAPMQWRTGPTALAVAAGLFSIAVLTSAISWFFFEKNTHKVRMLACSAVGLRRRGKD